MRDPRALALAATIGLALASGCATPGERDPWEPYNRGMFTVNEGVDRYVLEPVATGWDWILPEPVQEGVSNVFDNLELPVVFVNDVLQGKPVAAAQDVGRFLINSTMGIGGIFDVATIAELPQNDEDFGQTLAVWGVPSGPYFVLPLLGPSTVRDTVALPVDWFSNPLTWLVSFAARVGLTLTDAVNDRAAFLEEVRANREAALDYYVFVRNAWLQNRQRRIHDGEPPPSEEDDDLYYFDDE